MDKTDNIVLIGMPGSGKSTVGRILAERCGMSFIDADSEFEEYFKISPADYIITFGTPKFREKESLVLKGFQNCARTVIALGGGVVEIPSNREILKKIGHVVYIERDLDKLARGGRPLSMSKGVDQLYAERHEAYENWSDTRIKNEEIEKTVDQLISLI